MGRGGGGRRARGRRVTAPGMPRRAPKPSFREEAALAAWWVDETDRIIAKAQALDRSPVDVVMDIEALEDEIADLKARLRRYEHVAP